MISNISENNRVATSFLSCECVEMFNVYISLEKMPCSIQFGPVLRFI